jgi:hypothetical protein
LLKIWHCGNLAETAYGLSPEADDTRGCGLFSPSQSADALPRCGSGRGTYFPLR